MSIANRYHTALATIDMACSLIPFEDTGSVRVLSEQLFKCREIARAAIGNAHMGDPCIFCGVARNDIKSELCEGFGLDWGNHAG